MDKIKICECANCKAILEDNPNKVGTDADVYCPKCYNQAKQDTLKQVEEVIDKCEEIGDEGDNYLIDKEELKSQLSKLKEGED